MRLRFLAFVALAALAPPALTPRRAAAQPATDARPTLALTLDEAVARGRADNLQLRSLQLDLATARAQIREARSALLPTVSLASSYTRNIVSANPFAGSSAGGLFSSLGFVDWLAYNERSRTDANPATNPITLQAYQDSTRAGYSRAGITLDGGSNPFAVPNQFQNVVSVSQTLYNAAAFQAPRAARRLLTLSEQVALRQEQVVADLVRQQYYQGLLAQERVRVVAQSLERLRESETEIARRVEAGVLPRFQRLSAEVQRVNAESQLAQSQNTADLAIEALKLTLDLPADQRVVLESRFDDADGLSADVLDREALTAAALERRPDLAQARIAIELETFNRTLTRANRLPSVAAFANFGYNGSVPDNRTFVTRDASDPDNPFAFREGENRRFSSNYWQRTVSAGVRLNWTIFDGNRTSAQLQQRDVAIQKAQLGVETLERAVALDVQRSLLTIASARERLAATGQNVGRAEENYRIVERRLFEGVATQLELRDASEQLDQARLNYLQSLFDVRTARSGLDAVTGLPLVGATGTAAPGTPSGAPGIDGVPTNGVQPIDGRPLGPTTPQGNPRPSNGAPTGGGGTAPAPGNRP